MSDFGRKDTSDKVKESLTPEFMKSDTDKAREATTGTADKIAREFQPDHTKSDSQEATDKLGRSKDDAKHGSTHESIIDKAKHAVGMDKHDPK